MGECHLNLFALAGGALERRRAGQSAHLITGLFIDIARDLAGWRVGTALPLQGTAIAIGLARPVEPRPALMHSAGGPESVPSGADVEVGLCIVAKVGP